MISSTHSRYQFFLQIKQDVLTGKLEVPQPTAIELAALCVQCKYVDKI